jgi:uncharacterized membrane protein
LRRSDPTIAPARNIVSAASGKEPLLKTYALAYVATGLVFLAIDAIWLTLAGQRLYRPLMGEMLLEGFRLAPALLFYLIYIAGIVVFAIAPALTSERWTTATTYGAFLGLFAYATYDLTNQATLRHWPIAVTVADLCWGTFLTPSAATIGFLVTRAFTSSP